MHYCTSGQMTDASGIKNAQQMKSAKIEHPNALLMWSRKIIFFNFAIQKALRRKTQNAAGAFLQIMRAQLDII